MKTRQKGILFFAVVAGIMLTSAVTLAVNPSQWFGDSSLEDDMGIPTVEEFDAFDPDALGLDLDYNPGEKLQFCSTNDQPLSNQYVKEYKIPTECTQPLAITVDHSGNVWFAETNTGDVAKFDPLTETFTEYNNTTWEDVEKIYIMSALDNNVQPSKLRSMIWGIDYFPDRSIWFTDETTDAIWKFTIDEEIYDRISYSNTDESKSSLPQKLVIDGSKIIINDFSGGKLSFLDYAQDREGLRHYSIPSVVPDAVTSDFAIDSNKDVWYTNWVPSGQGILVKFDYTGYEFQLTQGEVTQGLLLQDFVEWYNFPPGLTTPNGVTVGPEQKIWLADTSSNYFFSFDPKTEEFTKYTTSVPTIDSYGNASGVIKNPVSRPYWIEHHNGNLIMNEQTANRIGVFNPSTETLIEYTVPSRNPNWADCNTESSSDCGVAQIFGFDAIDNQIWFTEWAENKIGVVDTKKPLPFSVSTDKNSLTLKNGESQTITLNVDSSSNTGKINFNSAHTASTATTSSDIQISHTMINPNEILVTVTANPIAIAGDYKLLLGVYNSEVNVSKFIDITIEP